MPRESAMCSIFDEEQSESVDSEKCFEMLFPASANMMISELRTLADDRGPRIDVISVCY